MLIAHSSLLNTTPANGCTKASPEINWPSRQGAYKGTRIKETWKNYTFNAPTWLDKINPGQAFVRERYGALGFLKNDEN